MSDSPYVSDLSEMGLHAVAPPQVSQSSWPGGWFVCEDGAVRGPLSANAAFSLSSISKLGEPLLVSRKGFAQWYPMREIAELYSIAEKLGQTTATETEKLELQIKENLANLELLRAMAQTGADPSVISRTKGHHHFEDAPSVTPKNIPQSISAPMSFDSPPHQQESLVAPTQRSHIPQQAPIPSPQPTAASSRDRATFRMSRKQKKALAKHNQQTSSSTQTQQQSTAPSGYQKLATQPITRRHLEQEYYTLRGRLRLGVIRNPWMSSLVILPLTLFLYWGVALRDLARDVSWHTFNSPKPLGFPPFILAYIPFVHIFMCYRVARLITLMERQNGYQSTSPGLAAFLSLCPPLALAYLQDSANAHWQLHVKNVLQQRAAGQSI